MNFAKLREMEKLSKGNPANIAKFTAARKEYEETIAVLFPEDSPIRFVGSPDESYVADAEARAKETGDAEDIARASLLRDRLNAYEQDATAHIDLRTTATSLRAKLRNGDELTEKDVRDAWRLAKLNASIDNVSLYSQVKKAQENPSERPPAAPEVAKVTGEDVEAARAAAQANPSSQNIARFSTAKREYTAQIEASE
ncbi:hypothetical protein ACFTAO_12720 [Paenibacillus rhizoplanae]